MKILVTGSNGQLGYDVLKELHRRKIPAAGLIERSAISRICRRSCIGSKPTSQTL